VSCLHSRWFLRGLRPRSRARWQNGLLSLLLVGCSGMPRRSMVAISIRNRKDLVMCLRVLHWHVFAEHAGFWPWLCDLCWERRISNQKGNLELGRASDIYYRHGYDYQDLHPRSTISYSRRTKPIDSRYWFFSVKTVTFVVRWTRLSLRTLRRCDIRVRIKRGNRENDANINMPKASFQTLIPSPIIYFMIISSWAL